MLEGDSITLFEKFLIENDSKYPFETLDIIDRLEIAGHETGILTESFDTNSSKLREDICTFKDQPGRFLRLFFIFYHRTCIILGGGGEKQKHFVKRQEVQKLNEEMELLEEISLTLQNAQKKGKFEVDDEGYISGIEGLIFNSEEL